MMFPQLPSVLYVFTAVNLTLRGHPTGYYLPEIARPHYCLDGHVKVDFASPNGAHPPVDPSSVVDYAADTDSARWMTDASVQYKLAHTKPLSEVDVHDYDAVVYPGGLAQSIDLPFDENNARIATEFWRAPGKIIGGICHGPAGLVNVTDWFGRSIFKNRRCTAFSNAEEIAANQTADVPFLVESRILELGGLYQKAEELGGVMVVTDGRYITAQNPASAKPFGDALLHALTGKRCVY